MMEEIKALFMQELEVNKQRQQRWVDKVTTKSASADAATAAQPSKRARKRANAKKNAADARAAQDKQIQELQQRLSATGVASAVPASPSSQPDAVEVARQALTEVSARAKARGGAVVGRRAVLEVQGQPLDVIVPKGTFGEACSDEIFGSTVVSELKGKPRDQLGAAMDNIMAKLFAVVERPPFGGGGASPAYVFGAAPHAAAPALPKFPVFGAPSRQ